MPVATTGAAAAAIAANPASPAASCTAASFKPPGALGLLLSTIAAGVVPFTRHRTARRCGLLPLLPSLLLPLMSLLLPSNSCGAVLALLYAVVATVAAAAWLVPPPLARVRLPLPGLAYSSNNSSSHTGQTCCACSTAALSCS